MKGKALSLGERKIIFSIFIYFKTENPSLKRNALVEMIVKATVASTTSVKRNVDEEEENKSPGKSRLERKKVFNRVDEFDLDAFILRQRKKPNISKTALNT